MKQFFLFIIVAAFSMPSFAIEYSEIMAIASGEAELDQTPTALNTPEKRLAANMELVVNLEKGPQTNKALMNGVKKLLPIIQASSDRQERRIYLDTLEALRRKIVEMSQQ